MSTHTVTNSTIRIYPNPAMEIINIEVPRNLKLDDTLYDLNGRLISRNTNKYLIEIQTVSLGVYLIEISDLDAGQKVVKKIIKGN